MADHTPDSPFGCPRTWGMRLNRPDTLLHVCNLSERHDGDHQCKCGQEREADRG